MRGLICALVILSIALESGQIALGQTHNIDVVSSQYCTPRVVQALWRIALDDEEVLDRICPACGLKISSDENVCSHCGNVFRKEEGDWEWKRIPTEDELKKHRAQKKAGDDVHYN